MKKILSVLLCLGMVFSLLAAVPQEVMAASHPAEYGNMSSSFKSGKYYDRLMNVTLTGYQIDDLIAVARSQVGYKSGGSASDLSGTSTNNKKYVEYFNLISKKTQGKNWCATFVSWCFREAGIPTSIMASGTGCGKLRNAAKSKGGIWHSRESGYIPKRGDIVLYESMGGNYKYYQKCKRDANGLPTSSSHVGIVSKDGNPDTREFTTIQRKGEVVSEFVESIDSKGKDKNGKKTIYRIQGFVTPAYTKTTAPTVIQPKNISIQLTEQNPQAGNDLWIVTTAENAEYYNISIYEAGNSDHVYGQGSKVPFTQAAKFNPPEIGQYEIKVTVVSSTGHTATQTRQFYAGPAADVIGGGLEDLPNPNAGNSSAASDAGAAVAAGAGLAAGAVTGAVEGIGESSSGSELSQGTIDAAAAVLSGVTEIVEEKKVNTRTGYVLGTDGSLAINSEPKVGNMIGKIPEGGAVTVYPDKTSGKWYWVSYNGVEGYSYSTYIKDTKPETWIGTIKGTAGNLAINSKPAKDNMVGKIPEGKTCIVFPARTSGKWYWVYYNGVAGYAYSSYIKK